MTGPLSWVPDVTVLIPAFNMAAAIGAAIGSALGQAGVTVEVLVIDDASTDSTAEIVAGMAARDDRVRLLQLVENAGPGAARSAGLARAVGDWIAVLDADDRFAPGRLAHLLGLATQHRLDAVADNLALVDPGLGRPVGTAFPLLPDEFRLLTARTYLVGTVPGGRINLGWTQPVVRRDFLTRHAIDWPALRHAEDMVFAMRLFIAGARFGLSGQCGYLYTQRRGTVSGTASPHSRTRRSVAEQQAAVATILAEGAASLPPAALRRLRRMPAEIAAANCAILARDAAVERQWRAAAGHGLAALARPWAFSRCLAARFGPGARFS
jgi:succinoglycan biosynthesis protein ExoO